MATCPKCGQSHPENREMCPHCGYPIRPIPTLPGGKLRFGGYDWYILDKQDDKMLLITENVIEQRPYHSAETAVTWATCSLRQYLNGEFYCSFSASDRSRILDTHVTTPNNPWYGTPGGGDTTDKIFLLSIDEVVRYFGDSGQIVHRYMYPNCDWCKDEFLPWIDDQYNINRRAVDQNGIVRHWRLRSPGGNPRSVASVSGFNGDGFDQGGIFIGNADLMIDGHFSQEGGDAISLVENERTLNGVRPALWLKTE